MQEQLSALEQCKLVIVSPEDFTDDEAEKIFLDTEVPDSNDVRELCAILHVHRPTVYYQILRRAMTKNMPQEAAKADY